MTRTHTLLPFLALSLAFTQVTLAEERGEFVRAGRTAFSCDFRKGLDGLAFDNYEQRLSWRLVETNGESYFRIELPPKRDVTNGWCLKSGKFAVTPDDDFTLVVRARGSANMQRIYGEEMTSEIRWYDAKGGAWCHPWPFRHRYPTNEWETVRFAAKVPHGAVSATVRIGKSTPGCKPGEWLEVSSIAFLDGAKWVSGDNAGPSVRMLTDSPNPDLKSDIAFALEDESGVAEGSVRIFWDGAPADGLFARSGNEWRMKCTTPWAPESVHRLRVVSRDTLGNVSDEDNLVCFGERLPPRVTVRDDGMLVVEGKPFFPIGLGRVKKCPANGENFERAAEMLSAAGFNVALTYGLRQSPQHQAEFFDAMERRGIWTLVEADDSQRFNDGSPIIRNLLAERKRKILCWMVADDTSAYWTPEQVARNCRFCHQLDGSRPVSHVDDTDYVPGRTGMLASRYRDFAGTTDIFLPELYPCRIDATRGDDTEKLLDSLLTMLDDQRRAKTPTKSLVGMVQAFIGWGRWHRRPTFEELRAQSWLSIICGCRGIAWYAYTGRGPEFAQGVADTPERWREISKVVREIADLKEVLVCRDAKEQPTVRILQGPEFTSFGHAPVRALLKETPQGPFLLAANATKEFVTVEFAGTGWIHRAQLAPFGCLFTEFEQDPLKPFLLPNHIPEYLTDDRPRYLGRPRIATSPKGRRLWLTYLTGGRAIGVDNALLLICSQNGGKTWTSQREPVMSIDGPGLLRVVNPTLWSDPKGDVWLFWGQARGMDDRRGGIWYAKARQPETSARQWSAPERICDGYMREKPTVDADGIWRIEPEGGQPVRSSDGGRTWSPAGAVARGESASDAFTLRLRNGTLIRLDVREGLAASLSEDGGATWTNRTVVDGRAGVADPDACETPDGAVHVVYAVHGADAHEIRHGRLTIADLKASLPVATDSVRRSPSPGR